MLTGNESVENRFDVTTSFITWRQLLQVFGRSNGACWDEAEMDNWLTIRSEGGMGGSTLRKRRFKPALVCPGIRNSDTRAQSLWELTGVYIDSGESSGRRCVKWQRHTVMTDYWPELTAKTASLYGLRNYALHRTCSSTCIHSATTRCVRRFRAVFANNDSKRTPKSQD